MAIKFIEVDEAGNIVHAACDPVITITPVVNRVSFRDRNGQLLQDAEGNALSPLGHKMVPPIRIDDDMLDLIMQGGGAVNFIYDFDTHTVSRKVQ